LDWAGRRALAAGLLLCALLPICVWAEELPLATMPPLEVGKEVPARIVDMIRIAQTEVVVANKQAMPRNNKYSIWYFNDQRKIGWCACFVSWCANQAGIPLMKRRNAAPLPDYAVFATNEAAVGNTYVTYEAAGRITDIPRPGYQVIYGVRGSTPYTHVGLVESVKDLGDGVYELTSLEGNVSSTCKRYAYRYILNPTRAHRNFRAIPAQEQTRNDAQYKLHRETWYITGFGQTWIPEAEQKPPAPNRPEKPPSEEDPSQENPF